MSQCGQLLSFVPEKTHVRNDRSQGAADVARCRKLASDLECSRSETWGASQHEKLIERPQVRQSNWRYRP
jgi:hypothetical protein